MAGEREGIAAALAPRGFIRQVALCASLVKFSHSIFALPFAISMAVYLTREFEITLNQFVWIISAVVCARTAAMSFNRLIDRNIDAQNPRTMARELPAGKISSLHVRGLLTLSSAAFFLFSYLLGLHCLIMSPLVLALLLGYSYTKRFTSGSHFVLGLALACAPGGVWYAVTGQFAWLPVWMMLGVLCWVAGFDILYSLQDQKFDSDHGLHSIPAALGARSSLLLARGLHVLAIFFLALFGNFAGLGTTYTATLLVFSIALFGQHRTISPDRLDKIEGAFFTRNAWASVLFLAGMILERLSR